MASTQSGFDDSVQANAMRSQNPMCGGSDLTCQSPEGPPASEYSTSTQKPNSCLWSAFRRSGYRDGRIEICGNCCSIGTGSWRRARGLQVYWTRLRRRYRKRGSPLQKSQPASLICRRMSAARSAFRIILASLITNIVPVTESVTTEDGDAIVFHDLGDGVSAILTK
jgi:hypothetical protein